MAMEMMFRHPKKEGWRAEVHRNSQGRWHVITVNVQEGWNDCPVKVGDRILYDFPERVPSYAKTLTEKAFRWLEANRRELER